MALFGTKPKSDKNDDLNLDSGGINLLPEEMREMERREHEREDDYSIELRVPKAEKIKSHTGRAPWFGLKSWFKREKSQTKKAKPIKEKDAENPKLKFTLLKQEQQQQSEEKLKQEVLQSVFGRPDNLPPHDYSLVNKPVEIVEPDLPAPPKVMPSPQPLPPVPPLSPEPIKQPDPILPNIPLEPEKPFVSEPVKQDFSAFDQRFVDRPKEEVKAKETEDFSVKIPAGKGFHLPTNGEAQGGISVNLIPSNLILKSWKRIGIIAVSVAIFSVIFCGLAYGTIRIWELRIETQTTELDEKIKQLQTGFNRFDNLTTEIDQLDTQIKAIIALLDRHVYWTKFFVLLEKYTLDDVFYDGLNLGLNGNLSLTAHGSEISTAARQLKLMELPEAQEFATDVSITQVTNNGEGKGVSFTIDFTLNSNLFYLSHAAEETPQQ